MKFNDEIRPAYWNLLSSEDKEEYTKLRKQLSSPIYKNRRNRSIGVFKDVIEMVKKFVVKGDSDDKNRALVAGIMFFETYQAINIHQLKILLSKSKSCINGLYQAMGYTTIPAGADSAVDLIKLYPFFKNNFSQLRTWTLRQKVQKTESKKIHKKNVHPIASGFSLVNEPESALHVNTPNVESTTTTPINEKNDTMIFGDMLSEQTENQATYQSLDAQLNMLTKETKEISSIHMLIDEQIFETPPPDVFDPIPGEVSIGDPLGYGEIRIPDLDNPYGFIELSEINQDFHSDDI